MNKKQVTVHVREVRKLEFDPMTDDRKLEDEVEKIRANVNWHKGDSVETLLAAYDELRKERYALMVDQTDPNYTIGMLLTENEKLRRQRDRLRESIDDFMDYFRPYGGVSDVPLGPFERAREALAEIEKKP